MLRRSVTLILLLCRLAAYGGGPLYTGSSIVAIRTPQNIFVGEDSKVVALGRASSNGLTASKIVQVDNLFFASAGLLRDEKGLFNVRETVLKARQAGDSIYETAERFTAMIVPCLTNAVGDVERASPGLFKSSNTWPSVEIIFFGVVHGVPVLCVRYFNLDLSFVPPKVTVGRLDCPGDCATGMTWAFAGNHTEMEKFLDSNPGYLKKNGFVPTINVLIQKEIEAAPDHVGPPIEILMVDKAGARWLQRKPQTPDVRPY